MDVDGAFMIIEIEQTASNITQRFEVFCNGDLSFTGALGNASKFQSIRMRNNHNDVVILGKYVFSNWSNYIPFKHLLGWESITRIMRCRKNEQDWGRFIFSRHALLKSFYVITGSDCVGALHAYPITRGSFEYISIYLDGEQVALVERYLTVVNHKNRYKIYLLDDYARLGDLLSFFVLYYDNWNNSHRFHMSSGTTTIKAWTFSRYEMKYEQTWREEHFPDENFFGKTKLFKE